MINPPELQIPDSSESYITSSVVQCPPLSLPHQRRGWHLRRLSDGGTARKGRPQSQRTSEGERAAPLPPRNPPWGGGGCAEPRCLHRSFVSVALPSTWSWLQTIQRSVIQSEAVTFSGLHRDRRGPCYLVGRGKDPAIYLRVMWKIYVQCSPWSLPHLARQMVALINNVIHSQSGKSPEEVSLKIVSASGKLCEGAQ